MTNSMLSANTDLDLDILNLELLGTDASACSWLSPTTPHIEMTEQQILDWLKTEEHNRNNFTLDASLLVQLESHRRRSFPSEPLAASPQHRTSHQTKTQSIISAPKMRYSPSITHPCASSKSHVEDNLNPCCKVQPPTRLSKPIRSLELEANALTSFKSAESAESPTRTRVYTSLPVPSVSSTNKTLSNLLHLRGGEKSHGRADCSVPSGVDEFKSEPSLFIGKRGTE
ncbi:hypothetical protein BJ741DRAFT_609588 [Chytriomyces cf. hyalinus JEL632]|nr:hypothetical protein BJ741DRAFT_609588 [Chytriomyces cf. hyalinus JEL632]